MWWPVLYVGRPAGKDEDGSYIWKLRDELSDAIDHFDMSHVALYVSDSSDEDSRSYWWLNANPKIWSFSDIAVGEVRSYTLYNENGNKRRIFQNRADISIKVGNERQFILLFQLAEQGSAFGQDRTGLPVGVVGHACCQLLFFPGGKRKQAVVNQVIQLDAEFRAQHVGEVEIRLDERLGGQGAFPRFIGFAEICFGDRQVEMLVDVPQDFAPMVAVGVERTAEVE